MLTTYRWRLHCSSTGAQQWRYPTELWSAAFILCRKDDEQCVFV